MEKRTFHTTKKVYAPKEQWDALDTLVKNICDNDKNQEVCSILIAYADIQNDILSDVFTPIIETKSRVSHELETAITFDRTIDFITLEYPIGYDVITIWKR